MGVALTSVVTDRPSGAFRTISSARTVSPVLNACARKGELIQSNLAPIGTTDGEHIEGVKVEALVDAEAGRAQLGEAVPQRRYLLGVRIGVFQWIPLIRMQDTQGYRVVGR